MEKLRFQMKKSKRPKVANWFAQYHLFHKQYIYLAFEGRHTMRTLFILTTKYISKAPNMMISENKTLEVWNTCNKTKQLINLAIVNKIKLNEHSFLKEIIRTRKKKFVCPV